MIEAGVPLKEQKSHVWERQEHDWYQEPKWCSERLFAEERFEGVCWDPACGGGNVVASGQAAGLNIGGSDIVNRCGLRAGYVFNFLEPNALQSDCMIFNPPFALAKSFVIEALRRSSRKVAALLPIRWIAGERRALWLKTTPLARVYILTPRPSMPPGNLLANDLDPKGGKVDFCWFVWHQGYEGEPALRWLRR